MNDYDWARPMNSYDYDDCDCDCDPADTTCAADDEEIEIDVQSYFDPYGRELGATICMRGHDVVWVEAWDVDGKEVQLDWVTREAIVTEALR